MKKLWVFSVTLLWLCALIVAPAHAQLGSGTLTGMVNDDQGNPLPGATVTAKDTKTGFERSDVTSATGSYRIGSLPFGIYDVTAQLSNFATQVKTDIRVDVGRTLSVDFGLRLSSTAEVLHVTGETPLVEKTESHISTVVTPEQVQNLPLNLRQFANLGVLAPGTLLKVNNDPTRPSNLAISLVGGSGRNYNTTIDGGDNNDDTIGGLNQFFPLEGVAEFTFLTNRYKAEYGRANGGVLNVVTKSGTNDVHGSFFSLFRNDSLNGKTPREDAASADKAPYDRKQFGGSVGGPIVKDKAHFFVTAERFQTDQQGPIDSGGIFPNLDGTSIAVPQRDTLFTGKFTSNIDPKQYLTVRYGQQKTTAVYGNAPYYAPNARGQVTNTFHSLLASHSYVVTENKLNEFVFQYADFKDVIAPASEDPTEIFPSGFYFGQNINTPQSTQQKKYQFKDDFSFTSGSNHHFKTGINFVHEPTLGGTFSSGVANPQFFHLTDDPNSPITQITQFAGHFGNSSPNKQYGVYFQDDWSVNDKLTINAGLRYDLVTGFNINQSGNALFPALHNLPFDFPWLQAFQDSADGTLQTDKNNIAPRIGFAYDWNGDGALVIRGGWGIYYDFPYTNANILFPQAALGDYGQSFFAIDPNGIRNPDGSFYNVNQFINGGVLPPNELTSLIAQPNDIASPDFVVPFSRQASAGFSKQMSPQTAIDVDYVNVQFRDQFVRFRANGLVVPNDPNSRLLPDFGNFRVWYNGSFADYNGLNLTFRHRATKHVDLQASYTLSKVNGTSLPGSDEFRVALPQNIAGCRDCAIDFKLGIKDNPLQEGPLDTDARHRIVLATTVELPLDFRVSGFFRANSSRPFNAFHVADLDGDGFAYSPADGGVNQRDGDGFSQFDLRIAKVFNIRDAVRIEGTLEVFNLFNSENATKFRGNVDAANFGTPGGFAGDPDQGEQRLAQLGFRIEF